MFFNNSIRLRLVWILFFVTFVSTQEPEEDPELDEDMFVNKFGNEQNHFETWQMMRYWFYKGGLETLKKFCKIAHNQADKGDVNITTIRTFPRTLNFKNKKYFSVRIDVVMYEIEESNTDNNTVNAFYITRGRDASCVYYLIPWQTDPHRFYLEKHVCGIRV